MRLTADQIEPCGYHLLIEMKEVTKQTESGIILTDSVHNREQAAMPIGRVLKVGPQCYKNHASGCNSAEEWGFAVGDWVQFPSHSYMRVAGSQRDDDTKNLVFVLDYDIKAKVNL